MGKNRFIIPTIIPEKNTTARANRYFGLFFFIHLTAFCKGNADIKNITKVIPAPIISINSIQYLLEFNLG